MKPLSQILKTVLKRIDQQQLENNKANARFKSEMRFLFQDKNLFKSKRGTVCDSCVSTRYKHGHEYLRTTKGV